MIEVIFQFCFRLSSSFPPLSAHALCSDVCKYFRDCSTHHTPQRRTIDFFVLSSFLPQRVHAPTEAKYAPPEVSIERLASSNFA